MKIYHYLFAFLVIPAAAAGNDLKLFTTDGCSAFPDGNIKQQSLWLDCCIRHDLAYWKGGSYEERLESDKALESCVASVGEPKIASIMLAGVRVGGSPYYPTPFRWGYGWPFPRGYKDLTNDEKQEVKQILELFSIMINKLAAELE